MEREDYQFGGVEKTKKQYWKCPEPGCHKKYKEHGSIKRHTEIAHVGVRHSCPECGKEVTRQYLLKAHREKIHGVKFD